MIDFKDIIDKLSDDETPIVIEDFGDITTTQGDDIPPVEKPIPDVFERGTPEQKFKYTKVTVTPKVAFEGYISPQGDIFKMEEGNFAGFADEILKKLLHKTAEKIPDEVYDEVKSDFVSKSEYVLMKIFGFAKIEARKTDCTCELVMKSCFVLTEAQYDAPDSDNAEIWSSKALYQSLQSPEYKEWPYERGPLGEGMFQIKQLLYGWWKTRFLVDKVNKRAYEIMGGDRCFKMINDEDIDWVSIENLPQIMYDRIKRRDAHFPFSINHFSNGKATVNWQINPDGRYFMDEDGYGMTDDIEVSLTGSMDRKGRIVSKFKKD